MYPIQSYVYTALAAECGPALLCVGSERPEIDVGRQWKQRRVLHADVPPLTVCVSIRGDVVLICADRLTQPSAPCFLPGSGEEWEGSRPPSRWADGPADRSPQRVRTARRASDVYPRVYPHVCPHTACLVMVLSAAAAPTTAVVSLFTLFTLLRLSKVVADCDLTPIAVLHLRWLHASRGSLQK